MMAGALGLVTALLYWYARSGVICTGSSSEGVPEEMDAVVQREVYFPGNTKVLQPNKANTVMPQEEEMESSVRNDVINQIE